MLARRMPATIPYDRANALQRALRRIAPFAPVTWLLARGLRHVDGPVLRLTRGGHTFASLVTGLPLVVLTTSGARSGRRRSLAVLAFPTAEGLVLIASNFGQQRHPAWYHNLRAHPECEIDADGSVRRYRAAEADGEQRERLWREGLRLYPGWAAYARRAGDRRIPVMVLTAL